MNQRLQQFLSAENISQAQFADTIDVARASVSHVLGGRNKPGYDFIKNIADHYPKLNLEWLITGKGKMYKETLPPLPSGHMDELFSTVEEEVQPAPAVALPKEGVKREPDEGKNPETTVSTERKIIRIVVFYDDNSYQEMK